MAITKEFAKGEVLYQRGEESTSVFILKTGSAILQSDSGSLQLQAGDVLGLFDVMLQRPYSADAHVRSDIKAIILTKQEVQSLQDGGLVYKIIQTSLKRVDADMPGRWS